jgi:hypothetical protein
LPEIVRAHFRSGFVRTSSWSAGRIHATPDLTGPDPLQRRASRNHRGTTSFGCSLDAHPWPALTAKSASCDRALMSRSRRRLRGMAALPTVREHVRREVADMVLRQVARKFGDAARAEMTPWFEQRATMRSRPPRCAAGWAARVGDHLMSRRRSRPDLDPADRESREQAVREAIASAAIEGAAITPATQEIFDDYVRGTIDVDDMVDRVLAIHGPRA